MKKRKLILTLAILFSLPLISSAQIKFYEYFFENNFLSVSLNQVQETSDGGYIIIGADHNSNNSNSELLLIRLDILGDTLWVRKFGGVGYTGGNAVQQTSDGGFVGVGITTGYGQGSNDIYFVKVDADGNTMWIKTIGSGGNEDATSVLKLLMVVSTLGALQIVLIQHRPREVVII